MNRLSVPSVLVAVSLLPALSARVFVSVGICRSVICSLSDICCAVLHFVRSCHDVPTFFDICRRRSFFLVVLVVFFLYWATGFITVVLRQVLDHPEMMLLCVLRQVSLFLLIRLLICSLSPSPVRVASSEAEQRRLCEMALNSDIIKQVNKV